MRNKAFLVGLVLVLGFAGQALAEEVLHLSNGSVLVVRSHEYEGDQIRVDLGANGFIAFPKEFVTRIEKAPGHVELMPSTSTDQMFVPKASTRVYGMNPRGGREGAYHLDQNDGTPAKPPKNIPAFAGHSNLAAQKMQMPNAMGLRMPNGQQNSGSRGSDRVLDTKVIAPNVPRPKPLTTAQAKVK